MMKCLCIILLFSVFFFSCTKDTSEGLVPEDYSGWKLLTETKLNYFIPGHESHYRIPYINTIGEQVEISTDTDGKKQYIYKKGTIIIKEIYPTLQLREGESPIALTVMIKDPGHPNAQGGWVWIVKDLKTNMEVQFKSDGCVNCHAGANGRHPYDDGNPDSEFRDYVFYPFRK
jgi:hypothetical protein